MAEKKRRLRKPEQPENAERRSPPKRNSQPNVVRGPKPSSRSQGKGFLGAATECGDEQQAVRLQRSSSNNSCTNWEPRSNKQGLFNKPIRRRKSQANECDADDSKCYPSSWIPEMLKYKPDSRSSLKLRPSPPPGQKIRFGIMRGNGNRRTADSSRRYEGRNDGGYTPTDCSCGSEDEGEAYDTARRLRQIEQLSSPPGKSQKAHHRKLGTLSPQYCCTCNAVEVDAPVGRGENETEWASHDYVYDDELPDQRQSSYRMLTEKQAENHTPCDFTCKRCLLIRSKVNGSPQGQPDWGSNYSAGSRQGTEDPERRMAPRSAQSAQDSRSLISDPEARQPKLQSSSQLSSGSIQGQSKDNAAPPESVLVENSIRGSCDASVKTQSETSSCKCTSLFVLNQTYFEGGTMPQFPIHAYQASPCRQLCSCACCFHSLNLDSAYANLNQSRNSQLPPQLKAISGSTLNSQPESNKETVSGTASQLPESKARINSSFARNSTQIGEDQSVKRIKVREQKKQCECVSICPNCGIDIQKFLQKAKNTRASVEAGSKMYGKKGRNSTASRRSMNSFTMRSPDQNEAIAEKTKSRQCRFCDALLQHDRHQSGGTENNFTNRCKCNITAATANAGHLVESHDVDEQCNVDQIIDILYEKVSQLKGQRDVLKPFIVSPVVDQGQNSLNPVPDNRHAWQSNRLPATSATYAPQPELSPVNYHWAKQSNQAQDYTYIASNPYPQYGQYFLPYFSYSGTPAANELQFGQNPLYMFNPAEYNYHVLNNPDYPVAGAFQNYDSVKPDPCQRISGQKYIQGKQAGRVEAEAVYKKNRESSGFEGANLCQKTNPYLDHEPYSYRSHPCTNKGRSYYVTPNTQNMSSKPPRKKNTEWYPEFRSRCTAHPTHNLKRSPSILHNSIYPHPCQERNCQKKDSTASLKEERKLHLKFNLSKCERNVQAEARDEESVLKSREEESNALLSNSQSVVNNIPVSENNEEIIDSKEADKGKEDERSKEMRENDLDHFSKTCRSGNTLTSGQNRFDESPLKVAHSVSSVNKSQSRERNPMELMLAEKRKQLRSIKFDHNLIKPETESKICESKQSRFALKTKHTDIRSMEDKGIPETKLKNKAPIPPPKPVKNNVYRYSRLCNRKENNKPPQRTRSDQCCRDDITVLFDSRYKFQKLCEGDTNIESKTDFRKHSTLI